MSIRDSVVKCDKIKNNKNELVFIGCPLVIHNNKIKNKKKYKVFLDSHICKKIHSIIIICGF